MAPASALGDLERAVMDFVWKSGPCDVKTAHKSVGERRSITLNTVQSTMDRLFKKGLLDREKVSHAFVYSAKVTREAFGASLIEDALAGFVGRDPGPMLSAFVDLTARAGGESLDRLERMIQERRAAAGDPPRAKRKGAS
jgi:predicted transcriptional regulator